MLGVTCPAVPPPVKIILFIVTSRMFTLFLYDNCTKVYKYIIRH